MRYRRKEQVISKTKIEGSTILTYFELELSALNLDKVYVT